MLNRRQNSEFKLKSILEFCVDYQGFDHAFAWVLRALADGSPHRGSRREPDVFP